MVESKHKSPRIAIKHEEVIYQNMLKNEKDTLLIIRQLHFTFSLKLLRVNTDAS